MAGSNKKTVWYAIAAIAANAAIAAVKGVAGALTGSSALLAEAAHSIADTANQGMLRGSLSLGERPPDEEHPFGYGKERFFWTLIASIVIFLAGAVFAVGDGTLTLLRPLRRRRASRSSTRRSPLRSWRRALALAGGVANTPRGARGRRPAREARSAEQGSDRPASDVEALTAQIDRDLRGAVPTVAEVFLDPYVAEGMIPACRPVGSDGARAEPARLTAPPQAAARGGRNDSGVSTGRFRRRPGGARAPDGAAASGG